MAYTAYEYDVFLSYAHVDDVIDASGKGWVEQFYEELKRNLPQRLQGHTPNIFFDRTNVASNHQLNKLTMAARNSAVFLAVASPNYAARPWTRDELSAFVSNNSWNDRSETRLFAIECLEPEDRNAYPAPLDSHIPMQFWQSHGSVAMPLRPNHEDYFIKLNTLASDIGKKLRELHAAQNKAQANSAATRILANGEPERCVLLAQSTDDLEEECQQIRSYLAQYDIAVLPREGYPQGGDAFRAAFAADIARAELFVQLLGPSAGRRPPDMPEGYTQFQAAAAMARGIGIMQWRSPELKVEAVTNPEHRKLISGEHVIADGLERFKAAVVQRAAKPREAPKSSASSFVFIDASLDDLDVARHIQSQISLPSAVPMLNGAPEDVRADLEENIVDCGVLVLIYGQTTPHWVRGQLRLYSKLKGRRSCPPRLLELIVEPPEDKEEHGMRLDELQRIRVRGPVDKAALQPLLDALTG